MKPLSINEAKNFIKKNIEGKEIDYTKLMPTIVTPDMERHAHIERREVLLGQIKVLNDDVYRKVLELRIRGVSCERIAHAMNERVDTIKDIEKAAIYAVQNELEKTRNFEDIWVKKQEDDISTA